MTDIEKHILEAAAEHPQFDKKICLAELENMKECDFDLIKQLWELRNLVKNGERVVGNENKLNSSLAYFLGITERRPESNFEICLRRTYGRAGFPDIDMDFDYVRRQEIVDYLIEKYGREYVGNIGNVQTLKTKAALRRAIKTLDPTNTVRYDQKGKEIKQKVNANYELEKEILKTLPGLMKRPDGSFISSVDEAYEEYPNFKKHMDAYPDIRRVASAIEGTISGFGVHAAGVLVSPVPLSLIAPMHVTTIHAGVGDEGPQKVVATQFPMNDVEKMGLIKFDILGLSTKTAIDWACKSIKEERDIDIDWNNISINDPETLALLNSGKTDGCFQLENPGMKECLKMIGIDTFDDLVVAIAMYRPGPKDYIPEYSSRKRGTTQVVYPHPVIERYTKKTYGVIVYQEQAMYIFVKLAGLTNSEGYIFIKGSAKKDPQLFQSMKQRFIDGASRKSNEDIANAVWKQMEPFQGYAFNKSLPWNEKIITTKQEYSIQELYNIKQREEELPQVFSLTGDPVDIVDVYDHGVLPVYEITLDDGSTVSSTLNHKFMTQRGVLSLHQILNENLEIVQNVGVINEEQVDVQRVSRTIADSAQIAESSTGVRKISVGEIQSQDLSMSRVQQRDPRIQKISCSQKGLSRLEEIEEPTLQQAKQNKWSEGLGADFTRSSAPSRVESEDQPIGSTGYRYSGRKETPLRYVAIKQEKIQISTVSRIVNGSSVLPRQGCGQNNWQSLRIQEIKFLGYEQCYDLEIDSEDHLYCLANGVINSNSHSVSYAEESFKTAYLKAHYPAEFIAARLSVETVRRNFDDVDKYERDAKKNFNFTIERPSLNTSKLHWSIVSSEERILRKPLLIKGVGIKAAEEIVKHQPYRGKDTLVVFTKKVGSAVNTKVIEAMKDAGFWEDIEKKKLLKDFEQLRKDKKRGIGQPNKDMFP